MERTYKLFDLRALLYGFGALLLLASCSSYQYAGYEDDGIYSSSGDVEAYTANDYEESYEDALYYERLFSSQAEQFGNIGEEGIIFTDIDTYSSGTYDPSVMDQGGIAYQSGDPTWGSDPDEIAVNIYNHQIFNPYYSPFFGPFYGYYDPFWSYGPYWRYPYYYDYYSPFGYAYGYHSWGWGYRWNYGWNYWRNPYYYGYNRSPYHWGKDIAYSSSRRDSYTDYDRTDFRRSSDARTARVTRYSNPSDVQAVRSNSDRRTYLTRTSRVRSSRAVRSDDSPTYRRSYDSSRDVRAVRNLPNRSNDAVRTRTSRPSSDQGSYRSSSSTRSSGAVRRPVSRSSRGRGN